MNIHWWHNIGLSGRTAILMVIPMILMILAVGFYVTVNKISSADRNANQRGDLLAKHLSSIVELGMVARDETVLASYADIILKEEGVFSVSLKDNEGRTFVEKNIDNFDTSHLDIRYFSAPVQLTKINVGGIENDLEEGTDRDIKYIGLVRIGVLTDKAGSKQEKILLVGLIGTFVGIVISTLIGYSLSRVITKPILRLNEIVSLLTAGRLSARVDESSECEIGALEKGVNTMAESLSLSQSNLQSKVDEATVSLNNTVIELENKNVELEKSRQKAVQLGNEKVQLLARISHELRTPLNSVIGFSRLLDKNISERERYEYTETIINSATQLTSVIDDVLLFSKLEFDSLSIAQEKFDPREVCEDTVVMLSPAAQKKNIELVLLVDKSVPDYMDGDAPRIKQVLTNLINNAIKFTDSGEIIVNVGAQSSALNSASKDHLSVSVTDTGCGINLEKFDTLFNEFSQVDNIRTRKSDGIGLGLSISRRLVRAMGGEITVSSEENEGSCFRFVIPLLNPINKSLPSTASQLAGKNVLLFEQHIKSRESLLDVLDAFGINVSIAENKSAVFDYLALNNSNPPDVLILALSAAQLASIDCESIVDEFKNLYDGPVLILTGISLLDLEVDMPENKQLLCLSKPLKKDMLYRNLSALLKIKNSAIDLQDEYFIEPWLQNTKALIVEDNQFNQVLLKTMLENRDAQVKIVSSGVQAQEAVGDEKFDVIFMDLHMPDSDGISVSRAIREGDSENNTTPVILVTADVLFDEQSLINDKIINCVLHKPIYEKSLDEAVEYVIPNSEREKNEKVDKSVSGNASEHAVIKLNDELKSEIIRLCDVISVSVEGNDKKLAKEGLHQLLGLSGYYQLKEVGQAVTYLQGLVNDDNWPASLLQIKKIKQLISG